MRLATYNIEWFDNLFARDGSLLLDQRWSRRRDVTRAQQLQAVARVLQTLDADAVMIIEAPDSSRRRNGVRALEAFARHFGLRSDKALIGFENHTQQEIALLYDPQKLQPRHDPKGHETGKRGREDAPRFDGVFRYQPPGRTARLIRFSKPPLEVALRTASGKGLRLIGVHVKSKAPHGAQGRAALMRKAIANRKKQVAQCIWLRMRVQQHLQAGQPVMVMGDFNDGPGLDEYEQLFGRSSVDIVLGEEPPRLFDPHAERVLSPHEGPKPTSARFYLPKQQRYMSTLLDYIMVSPDLKALGPEWRIWHPFEDAQCQADQGLRQALLMASDHFPVSIDLEI
ncbi:MAG: endonuclease [Rhodobacterales bacterium]|nr:MAG: endonuclease [Rhodobacterales bacterium]